MATPDGHSQAVTGRGHQRGQLILDTTRSCYLLHFFQQKTGSKLMWMQTCKHAVCSCSGLRGNSFMQGAPGPPPPKNTSTSSTASAVPWGHRRHPQQPQPSVKASKPITCLDQNRFSQSTRVWDKSSTGPQHTEELAPTAPYATYAQGCPRLCVPLSPTGQRLGQRRALPSTGAALRAELTIFKTSAPNSPPPQQLCPSLRVNAFIKSCCVGMSWQK